MAAKEGKSLEEWQKELYEEEEEVMKEDCRSVSTLGGGYFSFYF